jgi:hypothetical protein
MDQSTKIETPNKPPLALVGEDGNAFFILGRAQRAARRAGWDQETIKAVMDEATSGDYNYLLATMMRYFDC